MKTIEDLIINLLKEDGTTEKDILRLLDHYLSTLPNLREQILPHWEKALDNIISTEEEYIDGEIEDLLWRIFDRGEAQEKIANVMIQKVYAFRIIHGYTQKTARGRFITPSNIRITESLLKIMQALPSYEEKLLPFLDKQAAWYYHLWKACQK